MKVRMLIPLTGESQFRKAGLRHVPYHIRETKPNISVNAPNGWCWVSLTLYPIYIAAKCQD